MPDLSQVTLENLHGGAALEHFEREFSRVLENIQDPNTDPEAKRSVTVKVTVEPAEDRERGMVSLEVKTKLAPPAPVKGPVYMGRKEGELVAVSYDPRQSDLFDKHDPDVTPIKRSAEE